MGAYRNWWEMIPNLTVNDDNFQSWPSGHMSTIGVLIVLPLLADCLKKRSSRKNRIVFLFVCVYFVVAGYNRIQMAAHFLSDVCFGTLDACLITLLICSILSKICKIEGNDGCENSNPNWKRYKSSEGAR